MKDKTKLLKIRNARAFLKEATVDDLEKIQANISQLITERAEQEAAAEKERQEKERALDELLAIAKERGISKTELLNGIGGQKSQSTGKRRQYKVDDRIVEWGGRGPIPEPLRSLRKDGQDIEKYRIDND